jgi:NIMA (never in mitosis gene a)-related kinase
MKLGMIGKGCGGNCVYLVKDLSNNKYYAMKRIIIDEKNEKQNAKNQNEIDIFKSLKHPNLIQYVNSFIHSRKSKKAKFCIIMEYADDGDLFKVVKDHLKANQKIKEEQIWKWFLQICQAIRYIHSKKIIHRDIKCQNIFLLKNGQIKLGDFGISKVLMDSFDFAKTPLGTPYFLSPEICSGSKYNFKIDIWMLGCVLYELATLRKPFEATTLPELIKMIREKEILPIPKSYSDDLKFLINKLLCKEPNGRPSIKELLQYDFIVSKMKKFGFTNYYENWNECEDTNIPINENSPNYSLFNLGYGDLNGICNQNNNTNNDNNKHETDDTVINDADLDETCGIENDISSKLPYIKATPSISSQKKTSSTASVIPQGNNNLN